MVRFISVCFFLIISYFSYLFSSHYLGLYIDFHPKQPATAIFKTDATHIYINKDNGYEQILIKGVELDSAIPGYFATDYKAETETYTRWLELIADMGANTIKLNRVMDDRFYNAFYEFNINRQDPLYLLQSIWVSDYAQNSHQGAYSREFFLKLEDDCRIAIDVIHGNRSTSFGLIATIGNYQKDVSPWTLGYIVGTTWFSPTVAYTDNTNAPETKFSGEYIYTTANSSAFENLLAEVMDSILSYESKKYKEQRLVSFVNEPSTDPFKYLYSISAQIDKIAQVDANNIRLTEKVVSGFFASYHMYAHYTYFSKDLDDYEKIRLKEYLEKVNINTIYDGYIHMLNLYHDVPVLISSYGFSSSRGVENSTNGRLTEYEQGVLLAETYSQMIDVGCFGAIISSWQDTWSQKTWNTQHSIELIKTIEWSDYQTVDQFYGLLTFDPGIKEAICYVDGDVSEWDKSDIVLAYSDMSVSVKYDVKFLYFLVTKQALCDNNLLLLPIDTTPKTGSNHSNEYNAKFARQADFLIVLDGRDNSRVLVQRRYDVTRAMYEKLITGTEPYIKVPDIETSIFDKMRMVLKKQYDPTVDIKNLTIQERAKIRFYKTFETGALTYGNSNPQSLDYNSLADFMFGKDCIEIRIPWQLLNFSDPSEMMIHDDYYNNYGVESIPIDEMHVGLGQANAVVDSIPLGRVSLKGWGDNVTYHERLKQSYYIMQQLWR